MPSVAALGCSAESPPLRFAGFPVTREERPAIVKICILASSSAGNSTFIGTERTRVLIDAGLSRKEIVARLSAIGERAEDLNGILVTHEHSDHISGLPAMARAYRTPVYMTPLAAPAVAWGVSRPTVVPFESGCVLTIGDLEITSFSIPHDAVDPVGFCVRSQGIKVGICTDLGYMPDSIPVHLRGANLLVLESNHDLEMLKVGPYPWAVKQRVMSRRGHLSNDVACDFIQQHLECCTATLVLGHLSEHNNHPEIVRLVAQHALEQRATGTRLVVAEPRRQSEVFVF